MATLINTSSGRQAIQWMDGKRKTIRLGKMSEAKARVVLSHVDELLASKMIGNAPAPHTVKWVMGIEPRLHARFVKAGLIATKPAVVLTPIGPYFEKYIKNRTDLKQATIDIWKQSQRAIVGHFGETRELDSINRGDVRDWHHAMLTKFAAATVAMFVKKGRQIYGDAIDRGLVKDNPFKGVVAGDMSNAERLVYVTAKDILKVIEHCPDHEWRTLFALARFGGLRVPSETRALRWADIDWQASKIRVRSSKTEHHAGKASRIIPMFPELVPFLLESQEKAEVGAVHVLSRLRGDNLATTGRKIIDRAGIEPWEKTWQNLRSSCETDLVLWLPLHVACHWIGNSIGVARRHYLQVTDDHFKLVGDRAANSAQKESPMASNGGGLNETNPTGDLIFEGQRSLQEQNSPLENVRFLQLAHVALQKRLRQIEAEFAQNRHDDITRLSVAIHAARGRQ